MILDNAADDIAHYNKFALHYDLLANGIYQARSKLGAFSAQYEPYIVAGLIGFDMGRMMGKGLSRYDPTEKGFGAWLQLQLRSVQENLGDLLSVDLVEIDLETHAGSIERAYKCLAMTSRDPRPGEDKQFHVGATKILHWLMPNLFIMLDRNVASAFRDCHGLQYKRTTQPGYSAEKYIQCLGCAQKEIVHYDPERLRAHEPGTPLARLFDKVAWVAGLRTGQASDAP